MQNTTSDQASFASVQRDVRCGESEPHADPCAGLPRAAGRVPARVSVHRGQVIVSDAGPSDVVLLRNAGDVLEYARHTLRDENSTSGELRFAGRCLADALTDVLEIAEGAVDTGVDEGLEWAKSPGERASVTGD